MRRLNSFGVKLTLALALTVLIAVGALAVSLNRVARQQFTDYVAAGMMNRARFLAPLLADYRQAQGSWVGVERYLGAAPVMVGVPGVPGVPVPAPPPGPAQGPIAAGEGALILADATGEVVASSSGAVVNGRTLSPQERAQAVAISASGEVVGYVLTGKGPQEIAFEQRLNTSILTAGLLAGAAAIVLGVMLTRAVLQPLRVVENGARTLAAGNLSHRVPVASSDEIGALAHQFNAMAAALERQETLRRAMMADIAHELRTPLAVIRAQVEALQDGVFELTPENIAPIHSQALLLGRLIDDLRTLALAEAGQLPLECTEVALGEVVERSVAALQPQARERGVTLETVLAEAPPLWGDAQRLEQVLANLLSNALRYTPAGGRVTVRVERDEGGVRLSVADTGAGIAPDALPHAFERFYRADPSRARANGATGLGLAIARQLVQAHGGTISVESTVGVGSTFTVRLPLGACPPGSP